MNSSSESIFCSGGEPCSVTGVVGPCSGMVDVFRDLAGAWLNASVTDSWDFLFLVESVVVAWKLWQLCLQMRRQAAQGG